MNQVQKPGRYSSPPSIYTATVLRKHMQKDIKSATTILWGSRTQTLAAHLSFSSSDLGLCRPLHNFCTPASWMSLSERSRNLIVLELITEARTSQHLWVRLQDRRLDKQRRYQNLLPTMGCGEGISVLDPWPESMYLASLQTPAEPQHPFICQVVAVQVELSEMVRGHVFCQVFAGLHSESTLS